MQRRKVVLPQPEGPTMHKISCRFTSSVSRRKATTVPSTNSLLALSAWMATLFGSVIGVPSTATLATVLCERLHG